MPKGYLSTQQVAEKLGCSRTAVCMSIQTGKMSAEKFGRDYLIAESELLNFAPQGINKKHRIKRVDKI